MTTVQLHHGLVHYPLCNAYQVRSVPCIKKHPDQHGCGIAKIIAQKPARVPQHKVLLGYVPIVIRHPKPSFKLPISENFKPSNAVPGGSLVPRMSTSTTPFLLPKKPPKKRATKGNQNRTQNDKQTNGPDLTPRPPTPPSPPGWARPPPQLPPCPPLTPLGRPGSHARVPPGPRPPSPGWGGGDLRPLAERRASLLAAQASARAP